MKIVKTYSNGYAIDFLENRKKALWDEICNAIVNVDANKCFTKKSKAKKTFGQMLLNPKDLNTEFRSNLFPHGWKEKRNNYFVCEDPDTNKKITGLSEKEQEKTIVAAGFAPYWTYNQTDFVKDKIEVEVQFGKYSFVGYDLLFKHTAYWLSGELDVGVEIFPMKSMLNKMNSGPAYYENELYNLQRLQRGVFNTPIVLVGIDI